MKKYIASLFVLFAVTLVGCTSTPTSDREPLNPSNADAEVSVTGMSCPQCANNIKAIMDRLDGVDRTRVDLGAGRVLIAFEEGQTVAADVIKLAVKDSGFTPGKVIYKKDGAQ